MKKLFLVGFSLTLLGMVSCQKGENIVKKQVEKDLKETLHDLESYEFVQIEKIKEQTFGENIDLEIGSLKDKIQVVENDAKTPFEVYNRSVEKLKGDHTDFDIQMYNKRKNIIQKYLDEIKIYSDQIEQLELLKTKIGKKINHIATYEFSFRYRAKNKMGAKILKEDIIYADQDFEVFYNREYIGDKFYTPNSHKSK